MCIAAIIWEKIPLDYLESMEKDNPDGGGVAWEENSAVQFRRGLTAADIFALQEAGTLKFPYLLHFRWATHGAEVPELTHPFPLGPRALMGELEGSAPSVLIHNGTWGQADNHIPADDFKFPAELLGHVSDTAVAAWLAADDLSILDRVPCATAVAFMTPAGMDVQTRGRWYDKDRNWYSNLNWVPYKSVWSRDPYTQYFADKTPVSKEHEYAEDWDTWAEKWLEANVPQSARLTQLKAQHEARRRALAEQAKLSEADKETAWENYLRDKYGSEVADAVESDKLYEEIDASDMDTISEDPELVNSILARQMLG